MAGFELGIDRRNIIWFETLNPRRIIKSLSNNFSRSLVALPFNNHQGAIRRDCKKIYPTTMSCPDLPTYSFERFALREPMRKGLGLGGGTVLPHQSSPPHNKTNQMSRYVHAELRRKGVTLSLLWEEYRGVHPDGYGYSRYCELYTRWEGKLSPVMGGKCAALLNGA